MWKSHPEGLFSRPHRKVCSKGADTPKASEFLKTRAGCCGHQHALARRGICSRLLTKANFLLRTICSTSEDSLRNRWGCMWLHMCGNHQNWSTDRSSRSSPSSSARVPAAGGPGQRPRPPRPARSPWFRLLRPPDASGRFCAVLTERTSVSMASEALGAGRGGVGRRPPGLRAA